MTYININLLHKQAEPRLIFEANLDISKGKSNKTYSIKLPDTSYNNTQLDNLFGKYIGRRVSFPAQYTIEGVTLTGVLLITDVEKHEASATFITGNGVVWDAMQSDTLQDIDLSEYDIVLNKTNVLASESAYPMVVFDLTDRGAFKGGETAIDITDRFPSLNVKQLLIELFTAYGFYLDVTDNTGYFDELYLLFTGSDEIRNDADWLQDAAFEAFGEFDAHEDTGTGSVFLIDDKLLFTDDIKDPGDNYATSTYTVPETGTYQFKYDYNLRFQRQVTATLVGETARIYFKKNGTQFYSLPLAVDLSVEIYNEFTGTLDSKPIEFEAGDTIEVWIEFTGEITYSGTWNVDAIQGLGSKFYVVPSRWYGAGSTVEVTKILPSMVVSDFLKQTLALLNADVYFNENTNAVSLVVGYKQAAPVAQVEVWNYAETLEDKANTILQFKTDKARPQPDKLIKIVGAKDTVTSDINYSRTLVAPCTRLFTSTDVQIPVLWQAGDPLDFSQADTPPERKTTANLRILRKAAAVNGSYLLSYGGVLASNSETQSTVLQMQEVDIRSLHIQSCSIERKLIQCNAKLDVSKLYDNTYFKNEITIVDRRNSVKLLNGQLVKAEQIEFDIYKLTLYPTAQEQIDPSVTDWFTPVDAVNTTSQGGGGGGSSSTAYVAPADMWQSSVAGQIAGLTAKSTPEANDVFVIDDVNNGNVKKKTTLSNIYTVLKATFDIVYQAILSKAVGSDINTGTDNDKYVTSSAIAGSNVFRSEKLGQIYALPSQTIADTGMFMWESQGDSWAKVKTTFSLIKSNIKTYLDDYYLLKSSKSIGSEINTGTEEYKYVTPKAIADSNVFRSEKAGQINALTDKATPVDADTVMIDDSAASNAKKKISWATIKSLLTHWVFDTNGISLKDSTDYVGVGADSDTTTKMKVVKKSATGNTIENVLVIERQTSGTPADGLGGRILFRTELPTRSIADGGFIQAKLANSGTDIILEFGTLAVRFYINADGELVMSSGTNLIFTGSSDGVILKSPGGTSYKVLVDNSGTLTTTAI